MIATRIAGLAFTSSNIIGMGRALQITLTVSIDWHKEGIIVRTSLTLKQVVLEAIVVTSCARVVTTLASKIGISVRGPSFIAGSFTSGLFGSVHHVRLLIAFPALSTHRFVVCAEFARVIAGKRWFEYQFINRIKSVNVIESFNNNILKVFISYRVSNICQLNADLIFVTERINKCSIDNNHSVSSVYLTH